MQIAEKETVRIMPRPVIVLVALTVFSATIRAEVDQKGVNVQDEQGKEMENQRKKLESLERRVEELESTTVLSEPETRVKRIEVWVDDKGIEHDEQVPGSRRIVTYQRERVYRRQTINEKISEALEEAENRRVNIGIDASIIIQNVQQPSGAKTEADGNLYQLASMDLFFTAGIAQYTIFFADIVGLSGTTPDGEINGLTLTNGYTARLDQQNVLNLREAWLLTELLSQKLTLVAGRLDMTNYFDNNEAANDETTQFLSDALVNNPALGLSENGAGLAAIFDPKTGFQFKIGYQQSTSVATNLSDSLYFLSEVGYQLTPFHIGEGNYRLWYRSDNSGGERNSAFGISIDQKVTAATTLFFRFGSSEASVDKDTFYSAGVQFKNGVIINPEDAWGIGYSYYRLGIGDLERLYEIYYNLKITQKLKLSFNLTYISESDSATSGNIAYFVPGLRLQAAF